MKRTLKMAFFALCCLFTTAIFAQTKTLKVQIASTSDDAEERGKNATSSSGTMDLTSSDIELTNDGGDGDQFIGLRFSNIQIPQNALIKNAYIQFTVDETDNATGTVVFKVEDTDSASTFTSTDFDISSRKTLKDSVLWSNIPTWNVVGQANEDQQTPDLAVLVQAIVNRAAWKSGNALNIIATGTGQRIAESYDGTSSQAPVLVVEYIEPVTNTFTILSNSDDAENDVFSGAMDLSSSDLELTKDGTSEQLIGLRFDKISIPSGSKILSAYVQFTVDEVNTGGDVDLLIALENVDDAAVIANTANSLAARTFTDSILWDNIGDWSNVGDAGANQMSPDLSAQLQKVIDRKGWLKDNAVLVGMIDPVVLNVTGYTGNTSKRVAQSRDRSSSAAPKLIVNYIPADQYQKGSFPIAKKSTWLYNDKGVDLSTTNWTELNFNDSNWAFGNAVLGYGNGNDATTLDYGTDANNKHVTYYFRNIFEVADTSLYDSLVFDVMRDDGVVVYVNGKEAFRQNMPTGSVSFSTLASSTVSSPDETKYFRSTTANLLKNGTNVIAVELHQATVSSSDLSFDMEVGFKLKPLQATNFPLEKGTEWHYLDNGTSLDAVAWKDDKFNDDNWAQGKAPLGYNNLVNTTISYGPDASNKYITTYFRRDIDIDLASLPDSLEFGLLRDDGAIVYINGTELYRDNMPAGAVDYKTNSSTIVSGSDEEIYYSRIFPKSVFKQGLNTIAIELHNRDSSSSDLSFDLFIDEAPEINPPALGCANGNDEHIACFTSIAPTSQTNKLIIPSQTHRFQMLFQQGEDYTKGTGKVPGNHDFTAYVPLNGSSTEGHLSVNHENTPGGVSIVDLHFNDSTQLWVKDTTQAVDFFNADLVTTTRNCSGGITPWGTIITAEESSNGGDVNNDGYNDVGWLVEIDPITAQVKSYGNGKQEKLWAAGNISHENAVVLDDSITLYTGEDGGSSAVFKFVADKKTDLSTGTLYALKLDLPLIGGEPVTTKGKWVVVPNTTVAERNNTRSLAIALGATNFSGVEDIEISPIDGKMYFTSKGNGRVYRFTDQDSVVNDFETFVGGMSYVLNTENGLYTEAWGGGNDNLTFDDQGNLWVLQDGGRNYIWVVRADHTQKKPKVELFASSPIGSEPTGLTFSPDYKYAFVSIQHPSGSNALQQDATLNDVRFNVSSTIVYARNKNLGAQLPIAGFMADTQVVIEGNSVVFTDTSKYHPTSREWTFTGGTPFNSSKKTETVTYLNEGIYPVYLSVSNQIGTDSIAKLTYIEVIKPAPVVDFTADKTVVNPGDTVTFTDASTNNPTDFEWTFTGANISTSTDASPKVVYNKSGFYDVSLNTSNKAGKGVINTKSKYIEVRMTVNIDKVLDNNGLSVYPNPTNGMLNVALNCTKGEHVAIELYDVLGKKLSTVYNNQANGGEQIWQIDVSNIQASTVLLRVMVNQNIEQKVIHIIK